MIIKTKHSEVKLSHTLKIGDNAVTVPVDAYTAGNGTTGDTMLRQKILIVITNNLLKQQARIALSKESAIRFAEEFNKLLKEIEP
jgi:hypothetical protein